MTGTKGPRVRGNSTLENRVLKCDVTLIFRVPYPALSRAHFWTKKFRIPGGMWRIHGMVPHYLYLAIRTSARHEPRHVHKSPEIPRDARALEKS